MWGGNDYEEHQNRYDCWEGAGKDDGGGEGGDGEDGGNEVGYRINPSTPSKTGWSKVDKNTIVGPNKEVRTEHDV